MRSRVLLTGEYFRALGRRRGLNLIEQIERLHVSEPLSASGAFGFRIEGPADAPRIERRITVHALLDTRPRRSKAKTALRAEQRVASDEHQLAPSEPQAEEGLMMRPLLTPPRA